ncbi:serine/threonine-protein kinase Chk2-like [Ctenocephalides felis]|uniref:serine/threonine-protein kinase Chk2-like n=1 Tax=Ctenocephalides felis TaxID=7515 RepID=UPI000E6E478B|nr:serine/threonine-protein kinase Chk2-like [Ctenocephalides felis]XP_026465945.1 serine/threonine-protein kinase Chk2-like [Ctenocephalides felis]
MKQIIKSKADDEKKLNHPNRIMNEINIMKKLDHPFIVSVYNIVETPEAVFLVLELMNGGNTVLKTECGTAWYVAPEVILKNYKTYTEKVDVWSLGVILFVCLCGCLPFSAADQICKGKYSFKQCIWSSVSAECKDLISKMLKVDPKTRYSSSEVLNHKWLQDPDVIKRYNDLLNQENEKQEITVSDLEDSINEHCNNSCPENCLDIIEPPAKRHRSLLIF